MTSPRKHGGISEDDLSDGEAKKKQRAEPPVVSLEMAALRGLLKEQSDGIMKANQRQLDLAVQRLETKQADMFQTLHSRIDATSQKVDDIEDRLAQYEKRLAKVEEGSTNAGSEAAAEPPSRMTLVFGGWGKETRRHVIVADLQKAMEATGVQGLFDDMPFTTGPRRSVALANFRPRSEEDMSLMKRRMIDIITRFHKDEPKTCSGNRIWATFSKPLRERLRGSHCSWIKRVLGHLNIDLQHAALDLEHSTASVWLGSTKIGGIGSVEGKTGLYIDERNTEHPWIHVQGIAAELGVSAREVEEAIQSTQKR